MASLFARSRMFQPTKSHSGGTKRYDLHTHALCFCFGMHRPWNRTKARLTELQVDSGDLRTTVALPAGEDLNDWLAVHTIDCFNEITIVYGTDQACPRMRAGVKFEYLWKDNKTNKTPVKLSVPWFIDMIMTWEGWVCVTKSG